MSVTSGAGGGVIGIGSRAPGPPADAAFAIEINFQKGADNPSRVFQAADAIIRAMQSLDRTLCNAVDPHIEPVMVLEDIEAGSIKIWLANQLRRVEDDALKTLDWKPLVGKYLVKAKYAFISWSNKDGEGGGLLSLARDIRAIAQETDIKHIPDYAPPAMQDMANIARKVDEAKGMLQAGDKMSYISPESEPIDFNLTARWAPEELDELSIKETTKFEKMPLILIVKHPDYLGKSKWDFRQGKKSISARIDDQEWLSRFQARKIDVRPGDALRCLVTIEHKYGFDNELLNEEYIVTFIEGVLENQVSQDDLDL